MIANEKKAWNAKIPTREEDDDDDLNLISRNEYSGIARRAKVELQTLKMGSEKT